MGLPINVPQRLFGAHKGRNSIFGHELLCLLDMDSISVQGACLFQDAGELPLACLLLSHMSIQIDICLGRNLNYLG